jgi:hypothetical protein
MGIPVPNCIKVAFVKSLLGNLTHGDKGSTLLGIIAAAVLASGLDFGKLLQFFATQDSAIEWGKMVAIILFSVWGYFIGKKKPAAEATKQGA